MNWERNRKMQINDLEQQKAIDTHNMKLNRDSFANELQLLKKYYKDADHNFINGLDQLCTKVQNGFAKSKTFKDGYSLNSNWVVIIFIKIFDPLIAQLFPSESIVAEEFKSAHIQLPLAKHLTRSELYHLAEKLKKVEDVLEGRILENNQFNKQLIGEISTLGLLANILYYLNNKFIKQDLVWCRSCWRRAHKRNKYCSVHEPKYEGSNNNFKKGKKLFSEITNEINLVEELNKLRALRAAFNGEVIIISHDDLNQTLKSSNSFYILTLESTKALIESTIHNEWSQVSEIWDTEIKNEFPALDAMLVRKASSFANWIEFINSTRLMLKEEIENCSHPYWFLQEISIAEWWIRYENHLTDPKKLEKIIAKLSSQGFTAREIMEKVNLKKSRYYQISRQSKIV